MFKKILFFLFVGLLSYFSYLVATLPVSVVWGYLSPQLPLRQLQINIKAVSGTIWEGKALVYSRGIEGVLSWDISVLGLVTGKLPVSLSMESGAGTLQTTVRVSPNGGEVAETRGVIQLAALNPILVRERLTLDGDIKIDGLDVGYYDGTITTASGRFSWSGGQVKYPAGREVHESQFPPFIGTISQKTDDVHLTIRDNQSPIDIVEAVVNAEGVATLKVKRRLLDLANEPWPKNSSESDVVFKVRRKIL